MRRSAGACRCTTVPTTQSRSLWRGEKRGASAPKRARPSYRGPLSDMNSIPQHAVTNGYWKRDHLRAHCTRSSRRVVTNPASPPPMVTFAICSPFPLESALLPRVHQRHAEHEEEEEHLDEAEPPELAELSSPRVEE